MKYLLEELWYGNLSPATETRGESERARELMRMIVDCHDKLQASFTDKEKKSFEEFQDYLFELEDINEREVFVNAFRLGARFAMEVLHNWNG